MSLPDKVYSLCRGLGLDIITDPFLQAFLDMVHDFETNRNGGIAAFLRWWEETGQNKNISLPDGLEAVNMMTIHKSKGLEFPIVILAFADWRAFRELESAAWVTLDAEQFAGLPAARLSLADPKEMPVFESYREIFNTNKENIYLDNLNLMYVAFTRAVDELYILGCQGREDAQRVTHYFMQYIENKGVEGIEYVFGEKVNQAKTEPKLSPTTVENYPSVAWQERLAITINAPLNWQAGESSSTDWGKKVHSVLSKVKFKDEVESTLKAFVEERVLTADEIKQLQGITSSVINHPELTDYFTEGVEVLNEEEILLPNRGTLRPDRIVLENNKAHIIDYKTGQKEPKHKQQLEGYQKNLIDMGYEKGDLVLVYLQENTVVEKW